MSVESLSNVEENVLVEVNLEQKPGIIELLEDRWAEGKFLCVGLDLVADEEGTLFEKAAMVVEATKDIATAFKPNSAFYERRGHEGYAELKQLIAYIKEIAPDVPVIWDAKRGDIGSTSEAYADASDVLNADAMTIQPYLGGSAVKPMIDDPSKMGIVLAHTSNPGADEFQHLRLQNGSMLWEEVAFNVAHDERWKYGSPLGVVVGATYPEEVARARRIVGDDVMMLIPGIGKQGGDLEGSVRGAMNTRGTGFVISVSSSISQAKDLETGKVTHESIRQATLNYHNQIKMVMEDVRENPTPPSFHDRLKESGLTLGLQRRISALHNRIFTDEIEVIDPPSQHHQFASKVNHGRKLDADKILDGTDFYWQMMSTYSNWIKETYAEEMPGVLLGIAGGGNRFATTMASTVGAKGLETRKVDSKTVTLTDAARFMIKELKPKFVLLTEDVGTTGGTTSSVLPELIDLGIERIEAAHLFIRSSGLPKLESMGIKYAAVIHDPMPTFSEEDCKNLPEGFCNQGILLIPHGE